MNANELADLLDECMEDGSTDLVCVEQAATMLRQQQAEIEALKKDNKELHGIAQRMAMAESDARKSLQWIKDAKERQSEPVAWMDKRTNKCVVFINTPPSDDWIPLYTQPAKTLEPDCYGDGNVYRGVRSKDSEIQTIYIDSTAKTLTDEEILQEAENMFGTYFFESIDDPYWIEFARAILRKAQEK